MRAGWGTQAHAEGGGAVRTRGVGGRGPRGPRLAGAPAHVVWSRLLAEGPRHSAPLRPRAGLTSKAWWLWGFISVYAAEFCSRAVFGGTHTDHRPGGCWPGWLQPSQ